MNDVIKKLLKKRNVILVGKGKKITVGVNTGRDAIVVGVTKKVPIETLSRKDVVPKKIKGVETDVIQVGEIRALNNSETDRKARHRPAFGGISIGHKDITCGTLGMVVKRNGIRQILSNNHVLANENKASIGDPIYQPGVYDGGGADDEIAKLSDFVPIEFDGGSIPPPSDCPIANFTAKALNLIARVFGRKTRLQAVVPSSDTVNTVDCALARPNKDDDVLDSILEIGKPDYGDIEAVVGMKIKKSGRTSGLNHSEIALIDAITQVQYSAGTVTFEDQLVTSTPMAQGGDSGSAVLTEEDNKVVGLLFAGSDTIAIINKFRNVKEALLLD